MRTTPRSSGSNKLSEHAPLKLAVLADGAGLQRFALEAVNAVEGCDEVAVFACTNSRFPRRIGKHGFYYALNLLAVVNPWSRTVPLDRLTKRVARRVEFESGYDGVWQTLPEAVVRELRDYDLVFKAGMGLLRVPEPDVLPTPILSYHHGDPDKYRGRPGGFWEMLAGEATMGQIVQVIGNRLDAGRVAAFAETRVMPWSYRATLIESYRHSPLIINQAIRNARAGTFLAKPCTGRNYRLPSNLTVASFVARMAFRYVQRLLYGAFFEKRWKVSLAEAAAPLPDLLSGGFPPRQAWQTLDEAKGYTLYADPFFSTTPKGILVEALKSSSGLGEIRLVDAQGGDRRVSPPGGHMSYPFTLELDGRQYVVPEMAGWSSPKVFILEDGALIEADRLRVEGDPRLVDPTLFHHDDRLHLFANVKAIGSNALFLWSADRLDGLFRLHPSSPVRVSPQGSRMGGSIMAQQGRLFRIGQDFRSGYGDGLCAFEIESLTSTDYRERPIGELRFGGVKGPHTLNLDGGRLLFDWYRDRFSPLAGPRRLIARLLASRRVPPHEGPRALATDLRP